MKASCSPFPPVLVFESLALCAVGWAVFDWVSSYLKNAYVCLCLFPTSPWAWPVSSEVRVSHKLKLAVERLGRYMVPSVVQRLG